MLASSVAPGLMCRGGRGLCSQALHVYSSVSDVKSFWLLLLTSGQLSLIWPPSLLIPLGTVYCMWWVSRFPLFFQCDGAWWLLLTGLSWITFVFGSVCLAAPPSFVMHNSPSSSIVDGFNRCYMLLHRYWIILHCGMGLLGLCASLAHPIFVCFSEWFVAEMDLLMDL